MVKLKPIAADKELGMKLWNTSLTLTGLERQFPMYQEDGGEAPAAQNGAQVFSTTGEDTTGAEKRAAAAPAAAAAAGAGGAGAGGASGAAKQS